MKQNKRKLKVTDAKFNEQGVLISLRGTYNVYKEEFRNVEELLQRA